MLEKYPYNEEFEAWEVKSEIFDESVTILAQAPDELEFVKRVPELTERVMWLNDKASDVCDLLTEKQYTVSGDTKIELRPAEIAVVRCYAEMTPDGVALDLTVAIVATGVEKEIIMYVDEFDNLEVLGEYKDE